MEFHQMLSEAVNNCGISKNRLTKDHGINRARFYKYLDGSELIGRNEFHSLLPDLNLDRAQEQELIKAFYIKFYGKEKYERVTFIEQILKKPAAADTQGSASYDDVDFSPPEQHSRQYLDHSRGIVSAALYILKHSAGSVIYTNYPYSMRELDNELFNARSLIYERGCELVHLLYFDNGSGIRNTENIYRSIRWLKYQINPLCLDASCAAPDNTPFGYFFCSGDLCLMFDKDMKNGVIVKDELISGRIKGFCEDARAKEGTHPLGFFTQNILQVAQSLYGLSDRSLVILSAYPHLCIMADEQFINSVARNDIENRDDLVAFAVTHYRNILDNYEFEKYICSYNGLLEFAKSGRIKDIPSVFVNAADVSERIRFFKLLISKISQNDSIKILRVNDFELDNISITFSAHNVDLHIEFENIPDNLKYYDNCIVSISDSQSVADTRSLSEYLISTKKFLTREEAVSFLSALIEMCEQQD